MASQLALRKHGVGWMVAPKRCIHPEPGNVTLFGKSADVMKTLGMRSFQIIQLSSKPHDECPYKRRAEGNLEKACDCG